MPRFRKEKRHHDYSAAEQRARVLMSNYESYSPSDGSFENSGAASENQQQESSITPDSVFTFGKIAFGLSIGGALSYLAYRFYSSNNRSLS